jgi:hypothetical protein
MAKREITRRHEVRAELKNFRLAKAQSALTLRIFSKGQKVGELQVGRGSLYWWGKYKLKRKRINWEKFTELMNDLAYGRRVQSRR